jgi:hypothetical protein
MFGLQIVTKSRLAQIKIEAEIKAVYDLVALLKKKDKIFVEPVTLVGDKQKITNCAFLVTRKNGCGIRITTTKD